MVSREAKYGVSIFLRVSRGFEIAKVIFIFFNWIIYSFSITDRKSIKFQVKKYQATLALNLIVKEIFYILICFEDETCIEHWDLLFL